MTFGSIIVLSHNYRYIDGFHIRGLLTGFIQRYLPEYKNKVAMLQTPVISVKKNNKLVSWHYSLNDTVKLKTGEVSKYMKGLGSWKEADLKEIVKKDGIEKMIEIIDFDSDQIIDDWLGNDSEPRKKYILANEFSITKL